MKKFIAILVMVSFCAALLVGCAKEKEAPAAEAEKTEAQQEESQKEEPKQEESQQEESQVEEPQEEESQEEAQEEDAPEGGTFVGMMNPITVYDDLDGQITACGIGLEAPEGATDVIYQSINGIVETIFTLDGMQYSYRAQATDEVETYDMAGLYYEMEESTASVQERDAIVLSCDEASCIMWIDVVPGINYNLSVVGSVDLDAFIELANTIFVPVQGNN